ncbi:hypothetical protein [Bacillus sp. FJAT-47783]|nr:hypothetical protein [Bacillus sp. FJAT-47783]
MEHQKFDMREEGYEQNQPMQKSKKQGRKRRNEPKNAENSNEQS